jgi:hypothetical protein
MNLPTKIFYLKAPSDSPANELKPIGHLAIVLDGEAVVLCVDGMPDFNAVHSAQVPWRGLAFAVDVLDMKRNICGNFRSPPTDARSAGPTLQTRLKLAPSAPPLFPRRLRHRPTGLVSKRADRPYGEVGYLPLRGTFVFPKVFVGVPGRDLPQGFRTIGHHVMPDFRSLRRCKTPPVGTASCGYSCLCMIGNHRDYVFFAFVGGCLIAATIVFSLLVGGEIAGPRVAQPATTHFTER